MNKTIMGGENMYENSHQEVETKPLPNRKCPRCDSLNTKFYYFNNNKTSQPRYVCKNCKKFWTQGGTIRNIGSEGKEREIKRARYFPSPAVSSSPPLTIASAGGNVTRGGPLNLTRPHPAANHPRLKFVRKLSLTQGFNRVLNPYMASPQAQGQSNYVPPNSHLSCACLNIGGSSHYKKPSNANISGDNNSNFWSP